MLMQRYAIKRSAQTSLDFRACVVEECVVVGSSNALHAVNQFQCDVEFRAVDMAREELRCLHLHSKKIISLGAVAAERLLGRAVNVNLLGAYAFIENAWVRMLPDPCELVCNSRLTERFARDFQRALSCTVPANIWRIAGYCDVVTEEDAKCALNQDVRWFAYDVETFGTMFEAGFSVVSIATCGDGQSMSYVWSSITTQTAWDFLLAWLVSPAKKKVGHNVKYDNLAISCAFGKNVAGVIYDTRLLAKLLNPDASGYLEVMADAVGLGGCKEEANSACQAVLARYKTFALTRAQTDVIAKSVERGDNAKRWALALIPRDLLVRYNALDALVTSRLCEKYAAQLDRDENVRRVWDVLVKPASEALQDVERAGFRLSALAVAHLDAKLEMQANAHKKLLVETGEINWDSPKQVSSYVYNDLGISCKALTKSGNRSVGKLVLDGIDHPVVAALREYRVAQKLRSNYGLSLLRFMRDDFRVHASYLLDGARTGRLSACDPAIQTIPKAITELGKLARDCFVAEHGCVLISADYSQQELRCAALLSQDERMIEIFRQNVDYHQRTAEMIAKTVWNIDASAVEKSHRSAAKACNFGLMYGMQDAALATRIGCTRQLASAIREAVLGAFHGLSTWMSEQLKIARKRGYVETWWDGCAARKRPLQGLFDSDVSKRRHAERCVANTIIQGTAADFCLASLAEIVRWIKHDIVPARVVATVHDSILLEARADVVREVVAVVREVMTSWNSLQVPLAVDIETGISWGSLQSFDEVSNGV